MAIIQKLLSYVHPMFAHLPDDQASQTDGTRDRDATPPTPKIRRRASAPGVIELTNLRPPTRESSFRSSFASVYSDAVINVGSDSDSDDWNVVLVLVILKNLNVFIISFEF